MGTGNARHIVQWLSRSPKTLNIQAYQSFGTDSTVCTQHQESSTPNCESSTDVGPTVAAAAAQHPLASDSACSTDDEPQSSSSHISENSDPCTQSSSRDCVDIIIVSAALMLYVISHKYGGL